MDHSSIEEHREDAARRAAFPVGSEGIWTFVFIDMVVFALIFLVYSMQRVQQFHLYEVSQQHLNPIFGFVNTLVLLTSSWMMVRAVHSARDGFTAQVSSFLSAALVLGCVFVGGKGVEYYQKFDSSISVTTNSFFTFYFFITFVHLLHVMVGMAFMVAMRRGARTLGADYIKRLESLGTFWHFVDLIWLFIYALLYLM
jgi:nitric oxide reductase NorE protein